MIGSRGRIAAADMIDSFSIFSSIRSGGSCWTVAVAFTLEGRELGAARREATGNSEPIAAGPKVFDLLLFLLQLAHYGVLGTLHRDVTAGGLFHGDRLAAHEFLGVEGAVLAYEHVDLESTGEMDEVETRALQYGATDHTRIAVVGIPQPVDEGRYRRVMHRTTVAGEAPIPPA